MSKRLAEVFRVNKENKSCVFIPYLTAGYPTKAETVDLLLALEKGGADVIELGVPFTDPMADGATIQKANEIAIANHVTYEDCLGFVKQARSKGLKAPIILMGYYNVLLRGGEEKGIKAASDAGADGFIVVDLPFDEATTFLKHCKTHEMSYVPLVAPTSSDDRIKEVASHASTFLYVVSLTGVTGKRTELPEDLGKFVQRVRRATTLPLAIGFGISTRSHVEQVSKLAEGAIIGSAVIGTIDRADTDKREQALVDFVREVSGKGKRKAAN